MDYRTATMDFPVGLPGSRSLDRHIEQLYLELTEAQVTLTHLRNGLQGESPAGERQVREEMEALEHRLDITHSLIAHYTQLAVCQVLEEGHPSRYPQLVVGGDGEKENESQLLNVGQVKWFRRQLKAWARANLRDFSWRHTTDPYAVLIAETLLQQTKAERVATIYQPFMERYPNLKSLADASVEDIGRTIAPLGLAFRASRLYELAHRLLEDPNYEGKIPDSETELLRLSGVGRYTANAILAGAFGHRAPVLDTNVARILERFFSLEGGRVKSRDRMLWDAAAEVAPKRDVRRWNWTLIDFGALVCTARQPHCGSCTLKKRCAYTRDRA